MALLNIAIGILVGAVVMLLLLWVHHKYAKILIPLLAIGCAAGAVQLSDEYLYPSYLGWQFEREIMKQPLFNLIAQAHPQEFQAYLQKIKQIIKKGQTQTIPAYSAQLLNQIFFTHLQHAPDENVMLYLRATVDLYQYLYTKDPRAVVKLENNDPTNYDFKEIFADKMFQSLLNHLLDTKRFLIENAIKSPQPIPSASQGEPLLQLVLDQLTQKYGENTVHLLFTPGSEMPPSIQAKLFIEFYSDISNLGKERSGVLMRYIGSLRAQELKPAASPDGKPKA